jgi:salicylate hydroxylase
MGIEDVATLAECLSRAETSDQIPKTMRTYETIRKPRAEKLKNLSQFAGVEKHYEDGEKQQKRDELAIKLMDSHVNIPKPGETNTHPTAGLFGFDVLGYVSEYPAMFNLG